MKGGGGRWGPPRAVTAAGSAPPATQFEAAIARGDLDGCLQHLHKIREQADEPITLLSPSNHHRLLAACIRAGKLPLAIEYVRLLPPSGKLWSNLAAEANRQRDFPALKAVLQARQEAGLPQDARSYNAWITGLGGAGRLQEALASFREAWATPGCASLEVANSALAACARQGAWTEAQEVRVGERCSPCAGSFTVLVAADRSQTGLRLSRGFRGAAVAGVLPPLVDAGLQHQPCALGVCHQRRQL